MSFRYIVQVKKDFISGLYLQFDDINEKKVASIIDNFGTAKQGVKILGPIGTMLCLNFVYHFSSFVAIIIAISRICSLLIMY